MEYPAQETKDPKSEQILRMLTNVFVARCLAAVAELGIADILGDEAKGVEELARDATVDPHILLRILRALQSVGVFAQGDDLRFRLTPLAHYLRSDVEGSLCAAAAFMCHPRTWSAWGQLTESIRTSEPAFNIASGMGLFDFVNFDDGYGTLFNAAMRDLAVQRYPAVVAAYDFSEVGTLVDVAGGTGTLLALILKENYHLHGILFDMARVIADADRVLESYRVEDRCTKLEGDFFQSVPAGGDTYLLATVIHDWDDERASTIMRNCRRVMTKSGTLLLVEAVVPEGVPNYTNVLDVEMLVMTPGGRERTVAEYKQLFRDGGFEFRRLIQTDSDLCIIEGVPA